MFDILTTSQLATFCAVLVIAYIVFGVAGFGGALVATPLLAHFLPLATIIPLFAGIDLFASVSNVIRDGTSADRKELSRLVPLMLIGIAFGVEVLLSAPPQVMLLLLGIFSVTYTGSQLLGLIRPRKFPDWSVVPFGLIGGVTGALFGSGGFIYAIFLAQRTKDQQSLRVTMTSIIAISTFTRVGFFAAQGVYADTKLRWLMLLAVPAMLVGVNVGRTLSIRLPQKQFRIFMNVLVCCSGIVLLIRWASGH